MYLSVIGVRALDNYYLELMFENNEKRIFDMNPYLETGLFRKLKDENLFNRVKISFDTIEWPGRIDLDPEILYKKGTKKVTSNTPPIRDGAGITTENVNKRLR
jgi:hypothetical protein